LASFGLPKLLILIHDDMGGGVAESRLRQLRDRPPINPTADHHLKTSSPNQGILTAQF